MNSRWQRRTIGEVLQLEYGRPLPKADRKPNGKYPVYGANGEKDRTDIYFHEKPSIIVGRKGSAGELVIANGKFWPLDVTYFAVFDQEEYELHFLFYLLTTLELPKLAKGVKPGINRNDVYALSVVVPSLAEQQHIIRLLDKVFAEIAIAKANAERNLANVGAVFESLRRIVLEQGGEGWVNAPLSDYVISRPGNNGVIKGDQSSLPRSGLFQGFSASGPDVWVKSVDYSQPGVVVSAIGARCGKTFVADGHWTAIANTHVLLPSEKIDARWLWYRTNDEAFWIRSGTAQPFVRVRETLDRLGLIPPLSEQQRIADLLDDCAIKTSKLSANYKEKMDLLTNLERSVLNRTMSGKQKGA